MINGKHTFAYTLTLLRVQEVDFCKKRKNRKKKLWVRLGQVAHLFEISWVKNFFNVPWNSYDLSNRSMTEYNDFSAPFTKEDGNFSTFQERSERV